MFSIAARNAMWFIAILLNLLHSSAPAYYERSGTHLISTFWGNSGVILKFWGSLHNQLPARYEDSLYFSCNTEYKLRA